MKTLDHHLRNSLAHLMGRTSRAVLNRVQQKFYIGRALHHG